MDLSGWLCTPREKNLHGYNQVDIMGQTVDELLSIPYYPSVLRRVVSTPPLSQTTRDRRQFWPMLLRGASMLYRPVDTFY